MNIRVLSTLVLIILLSNLITLNSSSQIVYIDKYTLIQHNPSDPVYLSIADTLLIWRVFIDRSLASQVESLSIMLNTNPQGKSWISIPLKPQLHLSNTVVYYGYYSIINTGEYYFIITLKNNTQLTIYKSQVEPFFSFNALNIPSQVEWVKYGVGYQIFPDRFYNGDPGNDHYALIYDALIYDNTTNAKPILSKWSDPPDKYLHCCHQYFGGDLRGITMKLDYLKELGVRVIYLNPIFLCGSAHCYDTYDHYKLHPRLGTMEDLKTFLEEAHKRGIKVIFDFVPGHVGLGHFAFQDVYVNGPKSRYWNWFTIKRWPFTPGNGNDYRCWWGFGSLPQLNTTVPEVKEYLINAVLYWLEQGFDGVRIDTPLDLLNPREFFAEFRTRVKSRFPDAYIVGEIWELKPEWVNNGPFDTLMNYALGNIIIEYSKGGYSDNIDNVLSHYYSVYSVAAVGMGFNLVDSHDTDRVLTMLGGGILLAPGGPNPPREAIDRLKLLSVIQFTQPGLPVIYMGDELGLPGAKWNKEEHRYPIQWDKWVNIEVLEHYKKLGEIKNNYSALHTSIIRIFESSNGVLAYTRGYQDEILVLANNGKTQVNYTLPSELRNYNWRLVYSSSGQQPVVNEGVVTIPPLTAVILEKQIVNQTTTTQQTNTTISTHTSTPNTTTPATVNRGIGDIVISATLIIVTIPVLIYLARRFKK